MTNQVLHEKTVAAAQDEKSATLVLLEHLAEIDQRRLYATLAYSSLWEYVHKALGYSEAQSSERVNAVRVMVKVPEVRAQLAAGNLTLTSTAKLASHARRENLQPAETAALLDQISGKSSREIEKVFVAQSSAPQKPDRACVITPELTRITIEVDSDFLALVGRMKELNGNRALSFQEVFEAGMKDYIKKRDIKKKTESVARAREVRGVKREESRYIAMKVRQTIRERSGDRCEYTENGRRCESKSGLEFDHIEPHALGGANTEENLRHYCKCHNTLAAINEFGAVKMGRYLKL